MDLNGCTPLHLAFYCGHIKIIKILLDYSGTITNQDIKLLIDISPDDKKTLETIKILLDKSADINIKSVKNKKPEKLTQHDEIKQMINRDTSKQNLKHLMNTPGTYFHIMPADITLTCLAPFVAESFHKPAI